jgi:hypothetical protein
MENALIEELKLFLGLEGDDINDELLEVLRMSENFIYDYYGIAIFKRNLKELVAPLYGENVLYTKRGIISSITSINYNGENIDDLSSVYFELNKILFLTETIKFKPTDRIFVEYSVGYDDIILVPNSLKLGLFYICKKVYTDKEKNSDHYAQISTGVRETVKFIDQIPTMAESILSTYKVFRL